MFTLKRLVSGSLFVFVLAGTALAQENRAPIDTLREPVPAAPLVTATATAKRVRFVSPGTVVQLRLEVYNETGQKLFDTELHGGNVLDWHLQDGAGQRLPAGSYACVLTIKSLSGRLSQRVGLVTVNDKEAAIEAAGAARLSTAQQQAIGSVVGPVEGNAAFTVLQESEAEAITAVTHDGTDGQLTSTTGALTFRTGDLFAGKDVERVRITPEGNVGIGTDKPEATLDVAGTIRAAGAVRAAAGVEFADGTVQTTGLSGRKDKDGNLVPNVAGTGTQNKLAKWTDNSGTLGDSTFLEDSSGNVFNFFGSQVVTGGQQPFFEAQRSSSGDLLQRFWNTGTGGAKLRYVAGTGATSQIQLTDNLEWLSAIAGNNSIGLQFRVRNTTDPNSELALNAAARMAILRNGNVGIGTNNPAAKLDVVGNINTSTQFNIGGLRVLSAPGVNNTFAGLGAGATNMGLNNSFFGTNAGLNNTASVNSFFGSGAGRNNNTGAANSFFGTQAGFNNNTGGSNAFFGHNAGFSNQGGCCNNFFGASAGSNNNTGSSNSFFGDQAGLSNTTESNNTFIGFASKGTVGVTNATALGYLAQVTQSNSLVLGSIKTVNFATADTNVGIGTTAPTAVLNVVGSQPPAAPSIGLDATPVLRVIGGKGGNGPSAASGGLVFIQAGDGGDGGPPDNSAGNGGSITIQPGSPGSGGTTFPGAAGNVLLAPGVGNVGIGTLFPARRLHVKGAGSDGAGQTDLRITGTGQIASGITLESTGTGGRTYSWLSTADNTGGGGTGPGRLAVFDVTDNAYRMVIDSIGNVGIGTTSPGAKLDVNGSIKIAPPSAGTGAALCREAVTGLIVDCSASSARYKQNIFGLRLGLDVVRRLRPVSFTWKEDGQRDLGLVAEDVNRVEPLLVTRNAGGEVEGVRYDRLSVVLLNAVQEQQSQIEQQQNQLRQQKAQIGEQRQQLQQKHLRIEKLEKRLAALEAVVKKIGPGFNEPGELRNDRIGAGLRSRAQRSRTTRR